MLWEPIDLNTTCPASSDLTACSSFGYLYLDLLVRLFGRSSDKYPSRADADCEEYDFIVVGAGSAGCIVANRLSAFKNWKVLLLEAGPEEPDITAAPALEYALLGSNIDWQYKTQPDGRSCLAREGKQCSWPRGKTMGGSSSINSLAYVRGNMMDFDGWAKMGNTGWSYKEVLPYFKKSEKNLNIDEVSRKYHGTEGEQPISFYPYVDAPTEMLINGFKELGLPIVDVNGKQQIYITYNAQSFTNNGARVSVNHAFIRPIRRTRKNLIVETDSMVNKILINDKKVAYGVKYTKNGKEFIAKANKEVIISAGVIETPKLLLLSGIGPAEQLRCAGIEIIQDLAVGENLQDHVTFNSLTIQVPNNNTLVSNDKVLEDIIDFSNGNRNNPITADGVGKAMGFIKTEDNLDFPDIQYQFQGVRDDEFIGDPTGYNAINILPAAYYNEIVVRPMILIPKSRGVLKLNITHPKEKPLIYANYLKEPEDLKNLITGSKFIIKLEKTKAFKENGARFIRAKFEHCQHQEWGSDGYIECIARHYTDTSYHAVGTCKMGPESDKKAVVDPKLRVYGIERLRVIDSSIMPVVVLGNTNAASMLIGERGVDFVIDYWLRNIR